MSETKFTDADRAEAYEYARQEIAKAKASNSTSLNLDAKLEKHPKALRALATIPPEIAELTELRRLDLGETQVSDLKPLEDLKALEELRLHGTKVSNLSPVMKLPKLVSLGINQTPVADLNPLMGHKSLRALWLVDTDVQDLKALLRIPGIRLAAKQRTSPSGVYFIRTPITRDETYADFAHRIGPLGNVYDGTLLLLKHIEEELFEKSEPTAPDPKKPLFEIADEPPIRLLDPDMETSELEQQYLHEECRIKAQNLLQIVGGAHNAAPFLSEAVRRYATLIQRDADQIGARAVWSPANTMEAVWETHEKAIEEGRQNEELPNDIAATLDDLVQTHRVWYLNHPDARKVYLNAQGHVDEPVSQEKRDDTEGVIAHAEQSNVVGPEVTQPARENLDTVTGDLPAHRTALGEASDWAWNFVSAVSRKVWLLAKEYTKTSFVVGSIVGGYIFNFFTGAMDVLGNFAMRYMPKAQEWWTALTDLVTKLIS